MCGQPQLQKVCYQPQPHTCPQSASTWQKTYLLTSGLSSSFFSESASYRFTCDMHNTSTAATHSCSVQWRPLRSAAAPLHHSLVNLLLPHYKCLRLLIPLLIAELSVESMPLTSSAVDKHTHTPVTRLLKGLTDGQPCTLASVVSYQRLVCRRQVIQHAALEVATHGHEEVCGKSLLLCAQLVSQLRVIQHSACMVEAQRQQPSLSRNAYMPLPQCKGVQEMVLQQQGSAQG